VTDSLGNAAQSYEPGDVGAAAAAIGRWADDRRLLERARQAAWRAGETQYNWDLEKNKYLRVIDRVLARRPHAAASRGEIRTGELHA
jgi:glycosyltransferase involved in cell wall biosynthesis